MMPIQREDTAKMGTCSVSPLRGRPLAKTRYFQGSRNRVPPRDFSATAAGQPTATMFSQPAAIEVGQVERERRAIFLPHPLESKGWSRPIPWQPGGVLHRPRRQRAGARLRLFRGGARPSLGGAPPHPRRGSADRREHRRGCLSCCGTRLELTNHPLRYTFAGRCARPTPQGR
jgi:hypothetical protein